MGLSKSNENLSRGQAWAEVSSWPLCPGYWVPLASPKVESQQPSLSLVLTDGALTISN